MIFLRDNQIVFKEQEPECMCTPALVVSVLLTVQNGLSLRLILPLLAMRQV